MGTYNQPYVPTSDTLWTDNLKIIQGTGSDVEQYYDGTNWIFKPAVVGTGMAQFQRSAIGATATDVIGIYNLTDAAAGAQQYSGAIRWHGEGWKTDATAASQNVDWRSYVVPVEGAANPTSYLAWDASINDAAFSSILKLHSTSLLELILPGGDGNGIAFSILDGATAGDSTLIEMLEVGATQGGFILYAGDTNPTIHGRAFTATANTFNIGVNDNTTNRIALSIARDTGISTLLGVVLAGAMNANGQAINNGANIEMTVATDVSSGADAVKFGSYDLSAGNRTLVLATETAVAADVGLASTHSLTIRINAANYKVPLVSV